MSENHAQNDEDHSRECQVKCRGSQPGFEQLPLLPEEISDQNVSGGISCRSRDVVKKISAPGHFRQASQQIRHNRRKQENESRDKNRPGAMPFEKMFGPLHPLGCEMEPADFFQAATTQPSSQPKGTSAAQKASRRSGHHGLPQRIRGFSQNKSSPQENCLPREGNAKVVQKHDNEDKHISVMRDMGQ